MIVTIGVVGPAVAAFEVTVVVVVVVVVAVPPGTGVVSVFLLTDVCEEKSVGLIAAKASAGVKLGFESVVATGFGCTAGVGVAGVDTTGLTGGTGAGATGFTGATGCGVATGAGVTGVDTTGLTGVTGATGFGLTTGAGLAGVDTAGLTGVTGLTGTTGFATIGDDATTGFGTVKTGLIEIPFPRLEGVAAIVVTPCGVTFGL